MSNFKMYFRQIMYVLGAAVIIVGAIMGILSMMSPLVVYSIQLHDLVMILFAILDILWIGYVVWSSQRLGEVFEKGKQNPRAQSAMLLGASFLTGLVAAAGLFLAVMVTVFLLAESHLTYFLISILLVLSVLAILVHIEMRTRILFS